MDRDDMILQEYKLYTEQKENFIDRNFRTNRFYMVSFLVVILAMIFTSRHHEYDEKFCGVYTGEVIREIISVLPKLDPGLMERVNYLQNVLN